MSAEGNSVTLYDIWELLLLLGIIIEASQGVLGSAGLVRYTLSFSFAPTL